MKKLLWLVLAATAALAACSQQPAPQAQEQQPVPGQMPRMGY